LHNLNSDIEIECHRIDFAMLNI